MATTSHIRRAALVAALVVAGLLAGAALPRAAHAYQWPVKPFDVQHPVRGSFGDPRTLFHAPPTLAGLRRGPGLFSFHQGVDISAPDGTPVYPVAAGTVRRITAEAVYVDSGNGSSFEYWHIAAAVHVGDRVSVGETILGRILRGAGHVHLTENENGRVVNPLQPGHLSPYRDRTAPWVERVELRSGDDGPELMPGFVRGRVELLAEAYDRPALPVPGQWHGMPVSPAVVSWRIEQWNGKVVAPERTVYDVRETVPSNSGFWQVYARGTYQNMAVFQPHYSWLIPGCFVYRLDGSYDTRTLRDGVYDLVVTAADIAGNRGSSRLRFTVHNRAGFVGS